MSGCTTRTHVGEGSEYFVPDSFDLRGIFTNEEVVELFDDSSDGAIGGQGGCCDFAPAGDSFVGFYFDKEVFPPEGAFYFYEPWFY